MVMPWWWFWLPGNSQDLATPLFVAAWYGGKDCVTALVSSDADVNAADKVRARAQMIRLARSGVVGDLIVAWG